MPARPDTASRQPTDSHEKSSSGDGQSPLASQLRPEYVFSWPWFLGGLTTLILLVGGSLGLYFLQLRNLPTYILSAAAISEQEDRLQDACRMLSNFAKQYPDSPRTPEIWRRLDELIAKIGEKDGFDAQSIAYSTELKRHSTKKEQLVLSERIMNWMWEHRRFVAAMDQAAEVLSLAPELNIKDNEIAKAWQVYALCSYYQLRLLDYRPVIRNRPDMPLYIDTLLQRAYNLNPGNIEIANGYADYLRKVGTVEAFASGSSDEIRSKSATELATEADRIINAMVSAHPDDATAYMLRYRYSMENGLISMDMQDLPPDLRRVLDLDPTNEEARLEAGRLELNMAHRALVAGKEVEYYRRREAAIEHFELLNSSNPSSPRGYMALGDISLADRKQDDALDNYRKGIERIKPAVEPEIEARYIRLLTNMGTNDPKYFTQAESELARYAHFFRSPSYDTIPKDVVDQNRTLIDLLRGRLYATQGQHQVAEAERLNHAGKEAESRELLKKGNMNINEAIHLLMSRLNSMERFGQIAGGRSIYSQVVGESLMLLGNLKNKTAEWDLSARFFREAMAFPAHRQSAAFSAAQALQRRGMNSEALAILGDAVTRDPDNELLRYQYTEVLFMNEMSKDSSSRNFAILEEQLRHLEQNRDTLPTPWAVDLLRIQIQFARDTTSGDTERVLAAQQNAIRQYRALEKQEAPGDPALAISGEEDAPAKTFDQDLAFLRAMASIYSRMSSVYDFERVTEMMRDLPGGEFAFYVERARDAVRRDDREAATDILTKGMEAGLPEEQTRTLASLLEQVRSDSTEQVTSNTLYERLQDAYLNNPDSLVPQAVFLLANGAIDRQDWKSAKVYEDRLRQIEKDDSFGTMWRFIRARRLLDETDPNSSDYPAALIEAKNLQETIATSRPQWDMTYVLDAYIEMKKPVNENYTETMKQLRQIDLYKQAIELGNTSSAVWDRLIANLYAQQRYDEAQDYLRQAIFKRIPVQNSQGEFPQPYQSFLGEVFKACEAKDFEEADRLARTCIALAHQKQEKSDLIFNLNMAFGKKFLDEGYTDQAEKYLRAVQLRGGLYVYPLAVCLAKAGRIDEAFTILLDEIDRTPSAMPQLIHPMQILLAQTQPSEEVFERIDMLMVRIENGERLVFDGVLESGDSDVPRQIDLGEMRVKSLILRFPAQATLPDPTSISIISAQNGEEIPIESPTTTPAPEPVPTPEPAPAPEPVPTPEPASDALPTL